MMQRDGATDSGGVVPHLVLVCALAKDLRLNGRPAIEDGRIRQQIARNYAMRAGLDSINVRARLMSDAGMTPGHEGSLKKLAAVRLRQKQSELTNHSPVTGRLPLHRYAHPKAAWPDSWLHAPTT